MARTLDLADSSLHSSAILFSEVELELTELLHNEAGSRVWNRLAVHSEFILSPNWISINDIFWFIVLQLLSEHINARACLGG